MKIKIKVPKKIKMLTHSYKIRFDTKDLISRQNCALTRHFYQDIMLDNSTLPPSELGQVFLHEVLHTIERHFSIKSEDGDIDRMAEGLAVFLFDNLKIELDWSDIK